MLFTQETLDEIAVAREKYEEELRQIMEKIPGAEAQYVTFSGMPVKPIYTPSDIHDIDYSDDISFPGQHPYTRGTFPAGFLSRRPNIRQVTGFGTAEETNKRWKFLLSKGATALSVVPDDGLGYRADSDDERVRGLVGAGGVALDTLYDFETLFEDIDMMKYPVHLITMSPYALACYISIAQSRGIDLERLRGSMSNGLRNDAECIDIIEFCTNNMPLFNSGYLDMRNTREGGCTAAQEIAFGVATTMDTADALIRRGLKIDDFLHRVAWFVNAGPEIFEEAAKFRALRKVWAKIFKEKYDARNPKSLRCRMHCQIYAPTMTKQQPFNNLIRGTLYAMGAILGGVQSMHVNSFDEALALPTEFSASLSVRTQQIIDHETGVTKVIDPLGGSYYVEWLTKALEKQALALIDEVQKRGGATKARSWMQNEIRRAAYQNQMEFDSGERKLVGVNIYVEEEDVQMQALRVLQKHADFEVLTEYSAEAADKQIARLKKVRAERDAKKLDAARQRLFDAIQNGDNMIPSLIAAARSGLTRAEYASIISEIFSRPPEGPYVCSPPDILS
ncbi:MAG: methylmalonyl-CoA mutase family protein [Desulfobacterales bacterium]